MFVVQHRVDGMFWVAGTSPVWAAWTTNPARARRFATEHDAWVAAVLECTADLIDLKILAVAVPVSHLRAVHVLDHQ